MTSIATYIRLAFSSFADMLPIRYRRMVWLGWVVGTLFLLSILAMFFILPFVMVEAINTLFPAAAIEMSFYVWLACIVLLMLFGR